MKDATQLPFLIRLIDDKSPRVREKVAAQLRALGPALETEIIHQAIPLSPEQRVLLDEIAQLDADVVLRKQWISWLDSHADTEVDRLEAALSLLARWQAGDEYSLSLRELLDDVADEYLRSGWPLEPDSLAQWLFTDLGKNLHGASPESLYNPRYSNLLEVLENGRGIPISLASVFILVGHRVGLEIGGCNFPGHFLARARTEDAEGNGHDLFFDCFGGGRILEEHEVAALYKAAPGAMSQSAPALAMVARVLRNLVMAYEQTGSIDKVRLMLELLGELEQAAEV
jgi:regulator of sirC expression with transglutaminase-like and TPR domain